MKHVLLMFQEPKEDSVSKRSVWLTLSIALETSNEDRIDIGFGDVGVISDLMMIFLFVFDGMLSKTNLK